MTGVARSLTRFVLLGGLSLSLAGCVSLGGSQGLSLAPGSGAGSGTPVPAASLLEPLAGGLVGRAEASRLSRADRIAALQSEYRALEYTAPGDLVTWQGRSAGISGQVVASQPYRVGSQDCRQYTHTISAGAAAPSVVRGTACRNPDGSWALLS
ncbi:MAG: hypothetical protein JJ920_12320 [Roseitalea sp.]|jgi:surface antigen|nr:hypothetical protein [Roseitalea sp.]MBO6720542.1 hypothetical protein [Roseitalea sp.]MBO6743689.1 hypothetical protein [Roseitalea sp.]